MLEPGSQTAAVEKDPERRIQTVCLLLLTAVAVGATLYWLRPLLLPFVLALFLSTLLAPVIDFQTRHLRVPRGVAVLFTLLLGIALLGLLGAIGSASITQLAANREMYQEQLEKLYLEVLEKLPVDRMLAALGHAADEPFTLPTGAIGDFAVRTTNAVVSLFSSGALVVIYVLFLLIGRSTRTGPTPGVFGQIETRVKGYVVTKVLTSTSTGVLVFVVLKALGVEPALVFGLFTFLLNFIPSVGSIVATLLPLPVVLMSPAISGSTAVLAIVVPGVIQFGIGNVLEPKLMGSSLDLHPVVILVALIFWGMLWGIPGMFLATPITAVARILLEKIEMTRPVSELLAGRISGLAGEPESG